MVAGAGTLCAIGTGARHAAQVDVLFGNQLLETCRRLGCEGSLAPTPGAPSRFWRVETDQPIALAVIADGIAIDDGDMSGQ